MRKEIAPPPEVEEARNGVTGYSSTPVVGCEDCAYTDEPHMHGHILWEAGKELF